MAYFASAVVLLTLTSGQTPTAGSPPQPAAKVAPSSEFKLIVRLFGPRKPPLAAAEIVVVNGLAYQFITDAPEEVMIIDTARSRVQLLDLSRLERTEVTSRELDAALGLIHQKTTAAIERK